MAHTITDENLALIQGIITNTGQAMYDDSEVDIPLYRDGVVIGANGTNSFEAATVLGAVAAILGIDGPTVTYDRLCEQGDEG